LIERATTTVSPRRSTATILTSCRLSALTMVVALAALSETSFAVILNAYI
jgi:hypothetical protein